MVYVFKPVAGVGLRVIDELRHLEDGGGWDATLLRLGNEIVAVALPDAGHHDGVDEINVVAAPDGIADVFH